MVSLLIPMIYMTKIFLGGKKGHFAPKSVFASHELALNDYVVESI